MILNPSSVADRSEELKRKAKECRELLAQNGAAGLLLTEAANVSWMTGGAETHVPLAATASAGPLLVTPESVYLCCNSIETARMLEEEMGGLGIQEAIGPWYDDEKRQEAIEKVVGKGVVVRDTDAEPRDFLNRKQFVMCEAEIARYRIVSETSARVLHETCKALQKGWTELQVAGELAKRSHDAGIWPTLTLVAADVRIDKYRHPLPTSKTIERVVMVVLCARRWGLIANQTRLVHFGEIPSELQEKHQAVAQVDATFNLATRPGATYGEVFRKAQAVYESTGFREEWKLHHQGGITGYQGRYLFANPIIEEPVEAGHVVAWNPSITGTKSEDTILVTPSGPEVLTVGPDWPTINVAAEGEQMARCDILVR